jgi:hypothetical protein
MRKYAVVVFFGAHFFLGGCATNGSQLGQGTSTEPSSQAGANYDNSSGQSDDGITLRDAAEAFQDVKQAATEAKSMAYEIQRTINDLKGLTKQP